MVLKTIRAVRNAWRGGVPPPAPPSSNVLLAPGNQWYAPAVAGASTFGDAVTSADTVAKALTVLDRLTPDTYVEYVASFYRAGLSKFGRQWRYGDINTAVIALASALHPCDYLEIGVRRGRSLAMLAAEAPACHVVGCDLFISDYAGMENPGPDFVRREVSGAGFTGRLDMLVGDSKEVLPEFFRAHPDQYFDMVTVDGDHTEAGARADLLIVVPRLKIGGALVFDDVVNPAHPELRQVWDEVVGRDSRFSTFVFDEVGFGVAVGVRMR